MKKLFLTLAILALAVSAQATDLFISQTTNETASSTTYYSVESAYWPGGLAVITLEGTLHTAVCTIEYKPSGSSAWTMVLKDVGDAYNGYLFVKDSRPKSATVYLPEGCDIRGYLNNCGDSTSITLRIEE